MRNALRSMLILLCALLLTVAGLAQDDETPIPPEVMRVGRGVIHALAWSPDGERLAVASAGGVWLLDADLNVTERLAGREMHALAWSADGEALAASSANNDDCRLIAWALPGNERLFSHELCADYLAWHPDGAQVAAVQRDNRRVTLVDEDGAAAVNLPGRSARWSPGGDRLAIGGAGGLFIWHTQTDRLELARVDSTYGDVLAWTESGITQLCHETGDERNFSSLCYLDPISGDLRPGDVFIWRHPGERSDMRDFQWSAGRFSFVLTTQSPGYPPSLHVYDWSGGAQRSLLEAGSLSAWRADSALTIAGENGLLRTIDPANGEVSAQALNFTAPAASAAWSADGDSLVTAGYGYESYLRLWQPAADTADPIRTLSPGSLAENVRWQAETIITSGSIINDDLVTQALMGWSAQDLQPVYESTRTVMLDSAPVSAANSDLSRMAESDPERGVITLDDLTLYPGAPVVRALVWSPDDRQLASLSESPEARIAVLEVWDSQTGARISTAILPDLNALHPGIWWGSSGALLHITARTTAYDAFAIYAYDSATGQTRFQYGTPQFYAPAAAYSPDDSALAVETLTAIVFVNTQTGTPYRDQIPVGFINGLAWHPGGEWLAGASENGLVYIWDVSELHPPE